MKSLSPSDCDNCGTPLEGAFCHRCGQRKIDFKKDWSVLSHEVMGSFFHFEGKMLQGMVDMAFRPWKLTREFLEGKRVSSIPPLRAYLFVSVLFFLLLNMEMGQGIQDSFADDARGTTVVVDDSDPLDAETLKTMPQVFLRMLPRVFLVGVVVLALILKLVFFRYQLAYLEHLVLALHLQTFVLLWILVVNGWTHLIGFALPAVKSGLEELLFFWLLICPVLVFKKLFDISYGKALLKSMMVALFYSIYLMLGLVLVGFMTAWMYDLI